MNELKFLELHGDRVAYRDDGHGEVLLLIHGMAGSSDTWRSVIPQLSKNFRVIAPDLLGHGESAKPRSDYSLGAFAVFLRDLLDELGVRQATVVGHSLGGGVAGRGMRGPEFGGTDRCLVIDVDDNIQWRNQPVIIEGQSLEAEMRIAR